MWIALNQTWICALTFVVPGVRYAGTSITVVAFNAEGIPTTARSIRIIELIHNRKKPVGPTVESWKIGVY